MLALRELQQRLQQVLNVRKYVVIAVPVTQKLEGQHVAAIYWGEEAEETRFLVLSETDREDYVEQHRLAGLECLLARVPPNVTYYRVVME